MSAKWFLAVLLYCVVAIGFAMGIMDKPPICGAPGYPLYARGTNLSGALAATLLWPMMLGIAIERSLHSCLPEDSK